LNRRGISNGSINDTLCGDWLEACVRDTLWLGGLVATEFTPESAASVVADQFTPWRPHDTCFTVSENENRRIASIEKAFVGTI
jgi:hypothetical protein